MSMKKKVNACPVKEVMRVRRTGGATGLGAIGLGPSGWGLARRDGIIRSRPGMIGRWMTLTEIVSDPCTAVRSTEPHLWQKVLKRGALDC